ncbi:MAG: HAD family hydrolase, partial [Ilumatobacteraceae bacterium]
PIPDSAEVLRAFGEAGMPLGIVSNASGQIEEVLARSGVCQVGPGPNVSVRVIVDSHHVGVAKPDPRIFDFALSFFPDVELSRIAYVGDSVTMDIGGGRAAGLHAILLDPYDDHADADFPRVRTLRDLIGRFATD